MTSARSNKKSLTTCTLLSLWPFWRWRSELLTNRPLHIRFILIPFLCFGWLDASQHKLLATLHITEPRARHNPETSVCSQKHPSYIDTVNSETPIFEQKRSSYNGGSTSRMPGNGEIRGETLQASNITAAQTQPAWLSSTPYVAAL